MIFVGALLMDNTVSIPECHLSLHMPSDENDDGPSDCVRFLKLAVLVEDNLALDALLHLGRSGGRRKQSATPTAALRPRVPCPQSPPPIRCRIGITRDAAFCYYYSDNLHLLRFAGAELVPCIPLSKKRNSTGNI